MISFQCHLYSEKKILVLFQEAQKNDAILLNFSEKLHHVQEAAR